MFEFQAYVYCERYFLGCGGVTVRILRAVLAVALCLVLILFVCSCQIAVYDDAAQLKSCTWYAETANGDGVSLEFFEDSKARFKIDGDDDNTCEISGTYIIQDDELYISDKSLARTVCIEYRVYGKKLELVYMGGTLTLDKV